MKIKFTLLAVALASAHTFANNNEAALMQKVSDACTGIKDTRWSSNMRYATEDTIAEQLSRIEGYQAAKQALGQVNANYASSTAPVIYRSERGVPINSVIEECDKRAAGIQAGIVDKAEQIKAEKEKIKQDELDRIEKERQKQQAKADKKAEIAAQKLEIAEQAGFDNAIGSFKEARIKLHEGMSLSEFEDYLVVPEDRDRYHLKNVVGEYAIYAGTDWGRPTTRHIALLMESDGYYEKHATPPDSHFVLVGTKEFTNRFTGAKMVPVYAAAGGEHAPSSGGFLGWLFLLVLGGLAFKFKDELLEKFAELKPHLLALKDKYAPDKGS
ncbi:hypothetical protein [Pseudoalteromonas sp. OOF1S-7]|uniref:hypothetical protein n=1 Tax=Pseudoalteromonas sp. OOF1S-7 TaxID=2917757 RepID=UPI001EF539C4|nr:hypothetical protein [Pseudoalteromonas sp. OOF1S-7]MCG7535237.1 hypothetical protein [Pseudoalteromonas sp. OOF1S-7]